MFLKTVILIALFSIIILSQFCRHYLLYACCMALHPLSAKACVNGRRIRYPGVTPIIR